MRESPARGGLQVPRGVQHADAFVAGAKAEGRRCLFFRQPCAGNRIGWSAASYSGADRNAAQRAAGEATRGYGAEIVFYDPGESREAIAARLAAERGLTVVPSFDHPHIVAGQGTAAKELIEEVGPLDFLIVPCGGGGLLSGSAIAARHLSPSVTVVGVEPAAGDDATRSFRTRTLQTVSEPDTIADGARTSSLGTITFPLVLEYVNDMVTVTDDELLRSMFFLWERLKVVVEPTGALGAAAILENKLDVRGARVGVILSGGNADFRQLSRFL